MADSPSWKAHLELVRDEEPAGDFFGKWHSLFELCYQCYMALGGLKFYAKAGDKAGYDFVSARILSLLAAGAL